MCHRHCAQDRSVDRLLKLLVLLERGPRQRLSLVFEVGLSLLHKRGHPFLLVFLWGGEAGVDGDFS